MKSLSKLGLLLALIIAGRYLRLTEPAPFVNQEKVIAQVAQADTLRFASFATTQAPPPAAPASQHTLVTTPKDEPAYLVWY